MKKLLFTSLLVVTSLLLFAQSPLPKGSKQLNAGVGFSDWGIPVYVGLDFSVHDDFSLGGELGYRSDNYETNYKTYNYNIFSFNFNGNYHFNTLLGIPPEWDFYAGLNIGIYYWGNNNDNNQKHYYRDANSNSGVGLGAQIGGRYYFNSKFGLNLEFGGGRNMSNGGKFGITIKL